MAFAGTGNIVIGIVMIVVGTVAGILSIIGGAYFSSISSPFITGDERIELPLKVLETSVIPFDQSPVLCP